MRVLEKEEVQVAKVLFKDWKDTLVWSALEGYMGYVWVDSLTEPRAAKILTADFAFLAGTPREDVLKAIPADFQGDYVYTVPEHSGWEDLIEATYPGQYKKFMRYAIKKEKGIFEVDKLKGFIQALPEGYCVRAIDEMIYEQTRNEEWSMDLCSQFPSYKDYKEKGRGFVVMHGKEVVSGASSYTIYSEGIEIEIDTRSDEQRKGLALACAAALILECLEEGLYPSWDAANKASVALAEKLGYHFDYEYVTYAIKVK